MEIETYKTDYGWYWRAVHFPKLFNGPFSTEEEARQDVERYEDD